MFGREGGGIMVVRRTFSFFFFFYDRHVRHSGKKKNLWHRWGTINGSLSLSISRKTSREDDGFFTRLPTTSQTGKKQTTLRKILSSYFHLFLPSFSLPISIKRPLPSFLNGSPSLRKVGQTRGFGFPPRLTISR